MLEGDDGSGRRRSGRRRSADSRPGDGTSDLDEERDHDDCLARYVKEPIKRVDLRSVGGLDPPGRLPTQFDLDKAKSDVDSDPTRKLRVRKILNRQKDAARKRLERWRKRKAEIVTGATTSAPQANKEDAA